MVRVSVLLACGAVVALASAWAACASPYGADGAAPPDAPVDAATAEEASADAGEHGDADGGGDAEGGVVGCAHEACFDFETSATAGWDGPVLSGGGSLGREVAAGGAGTLRAQIPATGDGAGATAYVAKSFQNARGMHVELAVDITAAILASGASFSFMEITAGPSDIGLSVYIVPQVPNLALYFKPGAAGANQNIPAVAGLSEGQWHMVSVDVLFGAKATVHVEIDHVVALDKLLSSSLPSAPLQLRVGLQRYNNATPALSAAFDDVAVDVKR